MHLSHGSSLLLNATEFLQATEVLYGLRNNTYCALVRRRYLTSTGIQGLLWQLSPSYGSRDSAWKLEEDESSESGEYPLANWMTFARRLWIASKT